MLVLSQSCLAVYIKLSPPSSEHTWNLPQLLPTSVRGKKQRESSRHLKNAMSLLKNLCPLIPTKNSRLKKITQAVTDIFFLKRNNVIRC